MNKWMYKIRDFIEVYITKQTEAWTQGDKDILAEMLKGEIDKWLKESK